MFASNRGSQSLKSAIWSLLNWKLNKRRKCILTKKLNCSKILVNNSKIYLPSFIKCIWKKDKNLPKRIVKGRIRKHLLKWISPIEIWVRWGLKGESWRFMDVGDILAMLLPDAYVKWPKPPPTSYDCHQHILSLTSVTNIDVIGLCLSDDPTRITIP